MFYVDEDTKQITMHRGDTGSMKITFTGYDFSNVNAYALFTLKQGTTEVKSEAHQIVNNQITIDFANADTDWVTPGTFEYDVRVIIDPVFDQESGLPTDGTVVRTPEDPIPVTIKRTVGQI